MRLSLPLLRGCAHLRRSLLSGLLALMLVQGMVGAPLSFAQEGLSAAGEGSKEYAAAGLRTPTIKPAAKDAPKAANPAESQTSDGVLVIYADAVGQLGIEAESDRAEETLEKHGVAPESVVVKAKPDSGTIVKVDTPADKTDEALVSELKGQPGIAYVQPNYIYYPTSDPSPDAVSEAAAAAALPTNDPMCTPTGQHYLFATETDQAWQHARSEGKVTVAVLDSGCRLDHEDLKDTVLSDLAYDTYHNIPLASRPPEEQDFTGHGTAVSGLVSGCANNGVGIAGMSYNASVLPIKVSNDEPGGGIPVTAILRALNYLEDKIKSGELTNLRVINMSLGGFQRTIDPNDPVLKKITQLRDTYGVLSVAAGGNNNWARPPAPATYHWPSDYPDALSVTGVNPDKTNIAMYHYNAEKDISAYGNRLTTTWHSLLGRPSTQGYNDAFEGTSGASPVVAGVAALLWAANPDLSVDDAVKALQETADPIKDPTKAGTETVVNGSAGIVNARKAVDMVRPTRSLEECSLADIDPQSFTGKPLEPGVSLRVDVSGKTLLEGTDYTLSYANNTYAGTASITMTGIGDFTGERTTTFSILPTKANLVLLVRFQGDTIGDGDTGFNAPTDAADGARTAWEYLNKQYNEYGPDAGVKHSFRGYMHTISDGKHEVLSAFPQTQETGRVAYLTLPETREHYLAADENALISDAIATFNAAYGDSDTTPWDADNNAAVDNLTILATVNEAPDSGSVLWPHHGALDPSGSDRLVVGAGDRQKAIASYNIIDTNTLQASGTGVISHEYLHTLGAPDYYRTHGRTGTPVGVWDIMSSVQPPRGWPLAATRADRGWTAIPQKTEAGSYTLFAPGTGRDQSIMVKAPDSDEYFVVEYRAKGSDAEAMDGAIGNSGIIVYRVNPLYREQGNAGAEGDYIYVFRPGETALNGGEGNITNAQIAATGSRTSIGSANKDADFAAGALVYSDGTNSGITISATAETDDSLTFDLAFAENYEGAWEGFSGPNGVSTFGADVASVTTVMDNTALYACLEQGSGAATSYLIKRYNDAGWTSLGDLPVAGLESGSLALRGGELYFCGVDTSAGAPFTVKLYRYQASDNTWVLDRSMVTLTNAFAMESVGDALYIVVGSWRDAETTQVFRVDDAGFGSYGDPIPIRADSWGAPTIMDLGGQVALALGDGTTNTSQVYLSPGPSDTAWRPVAELQLEDAMSIEYASTVSVDNKTYLVAGARDEAPRLYTMTRRLVAGDTYENTLETVVLSAFAGQSYEPNSVSLAAQGSYLYLSVVNEDGPAPAISTYAAWRGGDFAPTSWRQVGNTTFTPALRSGGVSTQVYGDSVVAAAVSETTKKAVFRAHAALPDPDIISVEVPTSVPFTLYPDRRGGPDAQIEASGDIRVVNNSDKPVYTYISRIDVRGVSLVNTEADLSGDKTLMLALRDEMPAGFGQPQDYFPPAVSGASALNVRYYPFNRADRGMIAAATEAGATTSPALGLYGLALTGWTTNGEEFTITPTLTITTTRPGD